MTCAVCSQDIDEKTIYFWCRYADAQLHAKCFFQTNPITIGMWRNVPEPLMSTRADIMRMMVERGEDK